MTQTLSVTIVVLQLGIFALLAVLFRRSRPTDLTPVLTGLDSLGHDQERIERGLREELGQSRTEAGEAARHAREELSSTMKGFGDSLQTRLAEMSSLQQEQLRGFGERLDRLTTSNEQKLTALTQATEARLEGLRSTVDERLGQIGRDNAERLEQMRATVDEKLQGTLERRLGESFLHVSERLERVHAGLGEMQSLASGVGDLKRVLTNVKVRGGWGEVQLGALLDQVLAPEQFERNVKVKDGSIVEFAIKLPGRGDDQSEVVYLPIDSKFPLEDYQRLVDASHEGDAEKVEAAAKALASAVTTCAKTIAEKYVNPPATTDFAILFLPTEGLYAEVVRRNGLIEGLQRDHRVVVAGPSTFAALLNSLRVGFRTLAIEQRSSEVWKLLGAVKSEFAKFGDLLDGVKRKLDQASTTMEDAARKSRTIERRLRGVEGLPATEVRAVLGGEEEPLNGVPAPSAIRIARQSIS